jgi:hypothetical protein
VRLPGPTHLVVMSTTESKAKEALRQIQFVMSKLGLVLHPEKTRMVNLRRGKDRFVLSFSPLKAWNSDYVDGHSPAPPAPGGSLDRS